MAIEKTGNTYIWGSGVKGELGNDETNRNKPAVVKNIDKMTFGLAKNNFSCFITGRLYHFLRSPFLLNFSIFMNIFRTFLLLLLCGKLIICSCAIECLGFLNYPLKEKGFILGFVLIPFFFSSVALFIATSVNLFLCRKKQILSSGHSSRHWTQKAREANSIWPWLIKKRPLFCVF